MKKLFLGMVFILLDISVTAGPAKIGLLPDFAGCILMLKGLEEMKDRSGRLQKARFWVILTAVLSGIGYILDLFSLPVQWEFRVWLLDVGVTALGIAVHYLIVRGIEELEHREGRQLQALRLKSYWLYWAVLDGICQLCSWIPVVNTGAAAAALIMGICFLAAFYRSPKLLEDDRN